MSDKANAKPRKSFFVDMLVRDIELKDTLLDLLDNCVDGILRSSDPDHTADEPYRGYSAHFVISPEYFELTDNCGGIPLEIAKNKAFAIGNPEPIEGEDRIATVGRYGIGMKRAIFKLGENAHVRSWSDIPFQVDITRKWLRSETWAPLPLRTLDESEFEKRGTSIVIDQLRERARKEFAGKSFIRELEIEISQSYALIIRKGFAVTIRSHPDDPIPPPIPSKSLRFLAQPEIKAGAECLAPYAYVGTVGSVKIEVYAGLYRQLPEEAEREKEEETRGSADEAGWTVVCNDRVVVWKDRTRLTGWGEANVPNYHGQFIAISGIVLLHSKNLDDLPLTTTKKGVDGASNIYSIAKDMMREATKSLTQFTNKWKRSEGDLEKLYRNTRYIDLSVLQKQFPELPTRPWHKNADIQRYAPKLPVPVTTTTDTRVSFVAHKDDVATLGLVYFEDPKASAKDVGQEAFSRELEHYREAAE